MWYFFYKIGLVGFIVRVFFGACIEKDKVVLSSVCSYFRRLDGLSFVVENTEDIGSGRAGTFGFSMF